MIGNFKKTSLMSTPDAIEAFFVSLTACLAMSKSSINVLDTASVGLSCTYHIYSIVKFFAYYCFTLDEPISMLT